MDPFTQTHCLRAIYCMLEDLIYSIGFKPLKASTAFLFRKGSIVRLLVLVYFLFTTVPVNGTFRSPPVGTPLPANVDDAPVHEPVLDRKITSKEVCVGLEKHYRIEWSIYGERRQAYCMHECAFLPTDICAVISDTTTIPFFHIDTAKLFADVGVYLEEVFNDTRKVPYPTGDVSPQTWRTWCEVTKYAATLSLSLIPVLINQWKQINFWGSIGFAIAFMLIGFYMGASTTITTYNMFISALCLMAGPNSSYLIDSMWPVGVMFIMVCTALVGDPIWQMAMTFLIMLFFIGMVYWTFYSKKQGMSVAVVLSIYQVMILSDLLDFLRRTYSCSSLGHTVLEMVVNSVIPYSNDGFLYVRWFQLAILATNRVSALHSVLGMLGFVFIQCLGFILVRAALGSFYLYSMRYKLCFSNMLHGIAIYGVDCFGPFYCGWRMITRIEVASARRTAYVAVGCLATIWEFRFAKEWFVVRLIVSLTDIFWVHSFYGKTMHFLSCNIDFMQARFPQDGTPSVFAMEFLARLSKYTKVLHATRRNGESKGVGVIVKNKGSQMLYTIQHVVDKTLSIKYDERIFASPTFDALTRGADPVVAMAVTGFDDAPSIELLGCREIPFIRCLMFMATRDDECIVSMIENTKWSICNEGATIKVSLDLQKGDSGAPVFAALEDGNLRYCGAVSGGNNRTNGGNMVSFVTRLDEPDDVPNDAVECVVRQSTALSRPAAEPTSIAELANDSRYTLLQEEVYKNRVLLDDLSDKEIWLRPIVREEIQNHGEAVCVKWHTDYMDSIPPEDGVEDDSNKPVGPPDQDGADPGPWDREQYKKGKRRSDSHRRKDARYRKDAYTSLHKLLQVFKDVCIDTDANIVFDALLTGVPFYALQLDLKLRNVKGPQAIDLPDRPG